MYNLSVKRHFDAAHYLQDYVGKCNNMHGHRWDIEVNLASDCLGPCNMMIDFKVVKEAVDEVLDLLDHRILNTSLEENNPTAEYISKWLYQHLEGPLMSGSSHLVSVSVWESPDCCVTYREA